MWASLIAQLVRICVQCRRSQVNSSVRKICWRRDRLPTPVFLGFPCGSAGKESACSLGDLGLIPELERFPGEGKGYPLQNSGLENSLDCIVHGVTKSWTQLSDFHSQEIWVWSLSGEDPMQKGMAAHSSILAWKIPRTQVPGGCKIWTWLSTHCSHIKMHSTFSTSHIFI